LKQAVQVKESETLLTSDSSLCQNIVDDANHYLSTSIDELQGVEIKINNLQHAMDLLVD
jgi:hypothetical protein